MNIQFVSLCQTSDAGELKYILVTYHTLVYPDLLTCISRLTRLISSSSGEFSPTCKKQGQTFLRREGGHLKLIFETKYRGLRVTDARICGLEQHSAALILMALTQHGTYVCNSLQPRLSLLILRSPLISRISRMLTITLGTCGQRA